MSPPDEVAGKIETAKRQSAGADDSLKEQLRATFNEFQRTSHQAAPAKDLMGSVIGMNSYLSLPNVC